MIALMLTMHGQAAAQLENITPGELALTPDFCQDVQAIAVTGWTKTTPSPRAPKWLALMGETFWAMHHYCWALIGLQRADLPGTPPSTKAWRIRDAINDFHFVVRNSPADFVLLPDIHYRVGEMHVRLGDFGSALGEFERSRRLKPDYWPAYVGEANVLMKAGRWKQAEDLLIEGLKFSPNEANLEAVLAQVKAAPQRGSRAGRK